MMNEAEEQGMTIMKQEENHLCKCSFLNNESIMHDANYLGKRINRGVFKSKEGILINADVNGACNILKKAVPNSFKVNGIEVVGSQPTRRRLAPAMS